jgi:RimJ/RimL family protein N-acetyltransferase
VTGEVVRALLDQRFSHLEIQVVVGTSNPHLQSIEAQIEGRGNFRVLSSAWSMATLMADADFAIGAGGQMTWERAFLALPTLAIPIADNQVAALRSAAALGLVCLWDLPLTKEHKTFLNVIPDLFEALSRICTQVETLHSSFRENGAELISSLVCGQGCNFNFRLRQPRLEDEELFWAFFRDSDGKRYSFRDRSGVSRERHGKCFGEYFDRDARRVMYVVENEFGKVGQVKFVLTPTGWEIDLTISAQLRGCGLASLMLRQAIEEMGDSSHTPYWARVHRSNLASRCVFAGLGFKEHHTTDQSDFKFFRLDETYARSDSPCRK